MALKFKVSEIKRRAESRGEQTPDLSKRSKNIKPIASFNEDGDLKWNDELVKEIKAFSQRTKPRAAACGRTLNPKGMAPLSRQFGAF